ncbi:MAG TPA: hypothetical protein VLG67_03570 [Candidatus Saccharimonadales bacterium]|nr:hypothetical protein [Candidatus Saccharimonadales bacterium]
MAGNQNSGRKSNRGRKGGQSSGRGLASASKRTRQRVASEGGSSSHGGGQQD